MYDKFEVEIEVDSKYPINGSKRCRAECFLLFRDNQIFGMACIRDRKCLPCLTKLRKCFVKIRNSLSASIHYYIIVLVQLVYGTDIRSSKLGSEILKQAKNFNIDVEKYDFKYFPHIPIRKVSLPFPFLPLIALLSRKLLDYIWSTPNKETFITDITGYSENLLHIWVGELDEKQVRVYSSYLLSKNQTFHIIREKELINYGEKWFNKVYELLSGKTLRFFKILSYAFFSLHAIKI